MKGSGQMAEITIIPAKNRSEEIIRTAAYARVSSDSEDQLNSFATQIRYYTEMLQNSTNTVFVDMYADEGISGTSAEKRTEFQRLISDCRKGKIDRVLTKSISRFARNTKDSLKTARELKTLGVSVYFEKENIDTGEISSEMLLAIYSQFAQEESMSISRNCRLGIKKRMIDGTYKNATVPYGYNYSKGTVTVNKEQADTVKIIFNEYLSGKGEFEIAAVLNKLDCAKPMNAKEWYPQTISSIISNEWYIGDSLLQKKYTEDTVPFKRRVNHGEKEQFYISNAHEPIISREVFEAAQTLRKEKAQIYYHPASNKTYPLSRMIRCSCGSGFRRKKIRDHISWTCVTHDRNLNAKCDIKPIREEIIYNAFIKMFNKLQRHLNDILTPMLKQLERLYEKNTANNTQLAEIRKEIADTKQQIHFLTMLNLQGTLDSVYFTKSNRELDQKLSIAQKKLHAQLDDISSERLDKLKILIRILEQAELMTDFDEITFKQTVKQITVLSENEIRFDLIGDVSFTEQIMR
jgi:DNA invertase Pin-like site-specific DNA recombinase